MHRIVVLVLLLSLLAACGGGSGSPASSTTTNNAGPSSGSTVNNPAIINLSAGQTAGGVDIAVIAPASATPPNAQDLGVAQLSGRASAFNTGDVIHRGTTMRVVLFGPGLSGSMDVKVRGPQDITIAEVIGVTSTDGTSGISFIATVLPTAALGARTVVLQNSNGDVTTFTGGLEVVP